MNRIEEQWERFYASLGGKGFLFTDLQMGVMRNCFYSGALSLASVLMNDEQCSLALVSNRDVRRVLTDLTEEISQFTRV